MKKRMAALLLTTTMVLSACGSKQPANTPAGTQGEGGAAAAVETNQEIEVLKVALAGFPANLDPLNQIGIAGIKVYYNVFDTLLFTDKDGNITGQLAESWERLDDVTLQVKIHEGVTFHNGMPCTSKDIKFTFDRVIGGYGNGTISILYDSLDSVEIVDDLTVNFHLKRPDATFEDRLGSPWGANIISMDYTSEAGDEAIQTAPIGTGPYMLTDYSPEKFTLKRYDGFYGEAPAAKELHFILIPEASARLTALASGEVDIISDVSSDMVDTVNGMKGVSVQGIGVNNIHTYVYNTMKDNIMSNEKFRQAVTMAIDRQLLVDTLWGDYAYVPNGHQWKEYGDLYIEDYKGVPYDLEKAKQLVAESGYDGEEVITIEIKPGYYTNGTQAGEAAVSMLRDIGIKAEVKFIDKMSWDYDYIRCWSSASRFNNPLGALWMLFGPGTNPVTQNSWVPTEKFLNAGEILGSSTDLEERRQAALDLMEEFDTYCPGTYLYAVEDLYGIRDGLDWDMTYCKYQITPFRAGDLTVTK